MKDQGLHIERSDSAMGDCAADCTCEGLENVRRMSREVGVSTHESRVQSHTGQLLGLSGSDLLDGAVQLGRAGGCGRSLCCHCERRLRMNNK
jgi:hypothetical protein